MHAFVMASAACISSLFFLYMPQLCLSSWENVPLTSEQQYVMGVPGGEGFQKVLSIAYAPSNPDVVYLGTDTAQIWKSVNGGSSWTPSSTGFNANGARSLFVHSGDEKLVLAAGTLGRERSRVPDSIAPLQGVFRSVDGGGNWDYVESVEFYKQESTGPLFVEDSRNNNTIYLGTYENGLMVSNDKGLSWRATKFSNSEINGLAELPSSGGTLLIITPNGIYRYRDDEWHEIGAGLPGPPLSIATSRDAPDRVYAALRDKGVYRSDDGGQSFYKCGKGLPKMGANYSDIAVSPVAGDHVYVNTHKGYKKGPYVSNDGCVSWHKSYSTNAKGLVGKGGFYFSSPLAPHPSKPLTALTVSNGRAKVLRTENGGREWFYSGSGYTGARVGDIAFTSQGELYLALTDHGIWETKDKGKVFTNIDVGHQEKKHSSASIALQGETIVASYGGWKEKHLVISYDKGKTWSHKRNLRGRFWYIAFHAENKNIIYAGKYRSDDLGKTWKVLPYSIIGMSLDDADVVVAVDEQRRYLHLSSDRGETWEKINADYDDWLINDTSVSQSGGRIYVGSSKGIFIYDQGAWTRKGETDGLHKDAHGLNNIKSIAVDPNNDNTIYAGKWAPGKGISNGVFMSKDAGESWSQINGQLGANFNVWDLAVSPVDGSVYAGTTYGLYKYKAKLNE